MLLLFKRNRYVPKHPRIEWCLQLKDEVAGVGYLGSSVESGPQPPEQPWPPRPRQQWQLRRQRRPQRQAGLSWGF